VLFTPGHTLGHCAMHVPGRNVVIGGDAFVTLDPYTAARSPKLVARSATADAERNLDTLDAIAETGASTVLTAMARPRRAAPRRACARPVRPGTS
jgi:glyoxylase-like metal-dependent hydrolase (beta-lactamase superfamily II)